MKHEISFGALSAVIDEQGGSLCSFKVSGRECLGNGENRGDCRGMVNIFPFYGVLATAAQRQFNTRMAMGKNGIIVDADFFVEDKGQEYILLGFRSNTETRQCYPFDFLYKIEYRIIGTRLAVTYEVQNHSERDMFFACACAICLGLPLDEGLTGDDYDVEFLCECSPERVELSKEGYIVRRVPYELLYGHKLRLDREFPTNEDIILEGLPPRLTILSPKGGNIFGTRSQEAKNLTFHLNRQGNRANLLMTASTTLPPKEKRTRIVDMDDIITLPKNESYFMSCSFFIEQ